MGNDEFNKGNYSRAKYLYSMANHDNLRCISNVYEIDKDIQENYFNDSDLQNLFTSELDNINKILDEYEKNKNDNLSNIIGNEENKINIDNIINKIIILKGKCLVNLKKYDEAIDYYKNNNYLEEIYKKNELGNIYYNYKKDNQTAFDYFDEIK